MSQLDPSNPLDPLRLSTAELSIKVALIVSEHKSIFQIQINSENQLYVY